MEPYSHKARYRLLSEHLSKNMKSIHGNVDDFECIRMKLKMMQASGFLRIPKWITQQALEKKQQGTRLLKISQKSCHKQLKNLIDISNSKNEIGVSF